MEQSDWAAIALWASVACFALAAFGVRIGALALSWIWLGVALFVAGAYAIPALVDVTREHARTMQRRDRFDWEAFLLGAIAGFVVGVTFVVVMAYVAVEVLALRV